MARLSTDGTPPLLFYMAGQVAWVSFANCLDGISRPFASNAHLLGKVDLHRLAVPVAAIFSNLIPFGIQFAGSSRNPRGLHYLRLLRSFHRLGAGAAPRAPASGRVCLGGRPGRLRVDDSVPGPDLSGYVWHPAADVRSAR